MRFLVIYLLFSAFCLGEVRKEELTDALFPRTDSKIIGQIYQMLKVIDILFTKYDIPYWIDGGTALGAVRHKGCIPWDDDADLVFYIEDRERILMLKEEFAIFGFYLAEDNLIRLFASKEKKYPYIDLSGYQLCSDNAYRFAWKAPRNYYYNQFYWLYQEVHPLVRVPFGPLMLSAPNEMMRYLYTGYGMECLSYATFQKHHGGKDQQSIREKVRIVDFSPAAYKITNQQILLD